MRGVLFASCLGVLLTSWSLPIPEDATRLSATPSPRMQSALDETQKLIASDAARTDNFGFSVALQGDRALIGTPLVATSAGSQAGAAYVFERVDGVWTEQAKLLASDGDRSDNFGVSVALDGDRALIGAPGHDSGGLGAGAVYVFEGSSGSWSQSQKLTAADSEPGDEFGTTVSLDGPRALIGAHREGTDTSPFEGAAYVFDLTGGTWMQTQKLKAGDATPGDKFGTSVSLDGDRALIGAPEDDIGAAGDDGSAYVFDLVAGVWSEAQKLTASDATTLDYFGESVALDGDRALIGAYGDDPGTGGNYGSAYVFDLAGGSWNETTKLTAGDGTSLDWFGYAVALEGDRALIGAWGDNTDRGDRVGSAYVFDLVGGSWSESAKLEASDALQGEQLGTSVSLDGDHALLGAPAADINNVEIDAGAAYVYTLPDPVAVDPSVGEERLWISQTWPNPASRTATLRLHLQRPEAVQVTVLDTRGRVVWTMWELVPSGASELEVPVAGLAPGVYGVRVETAGQAATRRLIVI
ncbi:MAG: T9SS type A sorting domain-containing protein [Bacteroidota bacterium]